MECSIKFDSAKLGWPIIYIEGSWYIVSKNYCIFFSEDQFCVLGCVAQSVMCLATAASLTADSGGRKFDPGPVPYFRGD